MNSRARGRLFEATVTPEQNILDGTSATIEEDTNEELELARCKEELVHCMEEVEELKKRNEQLESRIIEMENRNEQQANEDLLRCEEEMKEVRKKNEQLESCQIDLEKRNEHLMSRTFEFDIITKHDLCVHYTGLRPQVVFILFELLEKVALTTKFTNVKILTFQNQLLLTLIKLRRNLSHHDLAFRFGVSYSTVQTVFHTIVQVLHEILFMHFMDVIPSRQKNQMFLPKCFKPYPNVRIVVDCTEIRCDKPGNMEKQKAVYSGYKESTTLKFLATCSTNGTVTFCSSSYPGSTSDKAITENTKILSQLVSGDMILADKGFLIADILPPGVSLNCPSFLNIPQFTENNVFDSRRVSRGRVHIERINVRLKRFLILSYIPQTLLSSVDRIVQLCCALVNLQNPILSECDNFFLSLHNETN